MICELCKHRIATIHIEDKGTLDICSACLEQIQEGLGYYINGIEVVKEEFKERTK